MSAHGQAEGTSNQSILTNAEELSAFVASLVGNADYSGREKRISQRHPFSAEVTIQQLDSNRQPVGEAIAAVTRDISTGGASLISPTFVSAAFLIVEIAHPTGTKKRLLMEVSRSRPFRKYFETGGKFVTEL
ncbi:hypothetical protein CA54_27380 [Symmachiella macrocystis]|uniref:PilZ domain-containing protein n=1 Tax=Symmachiella macrocystis TaxID=2527985 RepID=A0A5C6BRP3_9PLAN|nr:hypothetical protein CA54_27380 [Symmachiella macrocystis]